MFSVSWKGRAFLPHIAAVALPHQVRELDHGQASTNEGDVVRQHVLQHWDAIALQTHQPLMSFPMFSVF